MSDRFSTKDDRRMKTVCIPGDYGGYGGPGVFQENLTRGLETRGISVTNNLDARPLDAVCIIAAQRHLGKIWRCRRDGVRIVQRLNGVNWLHRVRPTPLKKRFRANARNWLCAVIRRRLAHHVVYQSDFSENLWRGRYGDVSIPTSIVYNGVDTEVFSPPDEAIRWRLPLKVIVVEGNLTSGYDFGFNAAAEVVKGLRRRLSREVALEVVGSVAADVRDRHQGTQWITWRGRLPHAAIPERLRSSHLFFTTDLNPACPNSVIEAMACGVPVIGYDTGAVSELIRDQGGCVVDYGADPWKLEAPANGERLLDAAVRILEEGQAASIRARTRAMDLTLDHMTRCYSEVLFGAS